MPLLGHLVSVWSLLVSMGGGGTGGRGPSWLNSTAAVLTMGGGLRGRNHVLVLTLRGGALGSAA